MLRVVFTLALAVALLAVTFPAVDHASVERSDAEVRSVVDRLVSEARALVAGNDAVPPDSDPARRAVTVDLPSDGFASAPIRSFRIVAPPGGNIDGSPSGEEIEGSSPGGAAERSTPGEHSGGSPAETNSAGESTGTVATLISWRVEGGARHAVTVDDVRMRTAGDDELRVGGGGTFRIVLSLVSIRGERVVTVERRTFK